MSPLYDFKCDTCGVTKECIIPRGELDKPIPHRNETATKCRGDLWYEGITKIAVAGSEPLDATFQTKAIAYRGEQPVGYVDGHFGKSARRRKR